MMATVLIAAVIVWLPSRADAETGGYPWASAKCVHTGSSSGACSNYDWYWDEDGNGTFSGSGEYFDQWGMAYRNCTSWVAWRLSTNSGYSMPFHDHAKNWVSRAQNLGIHHDDAPAVGSVAVDLGGTFGHVAYVESVNAANQTITVSEYNKAGTGLYGTRTVGWTGEFDEYIHFKDMPPSAPEGRPMFVASVQSEGTVFAKAGLQGSWVNELSGVRQAAVASDDKNGFFLVVLRDDGTILGKQGLSGGWITLLSGVKQVVAASDPVNGMFVAALGADGVLRGKRGMHGAWTDLLGGVAQVAISSDSVNGLFLGAVGTDGVLRGKQGMHGAWTTLRSGISQVSVTSDPRNGVFYVARRTDGVAIGKQGMHGAWTDLLGGVQQVAASSDSTNGLFVGVVGTDGVLRGKHGMHGAWTTLGSGISQVSVTSDPRNGVFYVARRTDGVAIGKQGMHGAWVNLISGSLQVGSPGSTSPFAGTLTFANQTSPTVSGTPQVGHTLSATPGIWTTSGTSYAYQWLADDAAISGATQSTYSPTAAVVSKRIAVRVTASKAGYHSVSAVSAKTAVVAPGTIANTARPSIAGTKRVRYTLTANPGSWTPSALTYRYVWLRDGSVISGATAKTYRLARADRGHRISVRVVASKTGYTPARAVSTRTAAIS